MRSNKLKINNRPKHIYEDNSIYFFSVRTLDKQWFLRPDEYKQLLLDKIKDKKKKYNFNLLAYVILNNHYHLLVKVGISKNIAKFIGEINGSSAKAINDLDCVIDRKIWWSYYDHIIRNEKDFYKHLNYIHQNPIKHGLSKNLSCRFSSYDSWCRKRGKEYMDDSFEKYPIVDFMIFNDEL